MYLNKPIINCVNNAYKRLRAILHENNSKQIKVYKHKRRQEVNEIVIGGIDEQTILE